MKNPTLPVESIREILLRLPVRSVLRFKCVCKSWLSVICDPQFGTSHYDLAAAPSHRLLLVSNDFYVESIDIDAAFNKDSAVVHFPLPPTSPHHYCANYHDKHDILGSCRGLVLLYYDRSSDLILWNPPLGVYIRFPDFEYDILHQYLYGFGYDASADDYLLILISLPEDEHVVETDVYICSFKTERWKWKGNRIDFPYENLDHKFKAASLFNGALHWLVRSEGKEVPVIIAFDLTQRSLSEIPLLNHLTMEEYEAYSLTVMGGCLGVCCLVHGWARVEIWVMKEYKVQSSWTKTIVIPTYGRPRNFFSPICVAKDGQIFVSNIRGRLEKLNDKGERLDHLNYGGGDLYKANLQFAMYRESLLSLPTPVLLGLTSEHDQQ